MWIWHSLPRVSEGIPAAGMELALALRLFQQNQPSLFGDSSDRRERHSMKSLWQHVQPARSNGEEQLIVVTAMQRQLEGIECRTATGFGRANDGKQSTVHKRADATCCTEPRQVRGKSIGEVHHRCRQAFLCQPLTHGESRFGVELFYEKGITGARLGLAALQQAQS